MKGFGGMQPNLTDDTGRYFERINDGVGSVHGLSVLQIMQLDSENRILEDRRQTAPCCIWYSNRRKHVSKPLRTHYEDPQ